MPKREIIPVARRMPDGRLGIVERHLAVTEKKLSKSEQLAQATAMYQRRLFDPNASINNLAEEFGLCKETVTARLALARKDGVPDQAREVFIQEMLPAAMAVLMEALRDGDRKVAVKVIELLKAAELPEDAKPALDTDADSLEVWRERIKIVRKPNEQTANTSRDVQAAGDSIEGTLLPPTSPPHADAQPAASAETSSEVGDARRMAQGDEVDSASSSGA